ncbi:MAG: hypothetical protein K2X94_04830 [Amoebophilaceae bacterium]|nr:hypothetical protein [Amoebophilaceae bacterium]
MDSNKAPITNKHSSRYALSILFCFSFSPITARPDQQAIVLLHGLNKGSSDLKTMKQSLEKAFPYATIIALESVAKDPNKSSLITPAPSVALPIRKQAHLAYKEIKAKVGKDKQLVLVGHSQGGLVAFAMAKTYGQTLNREQQICIKQLITIATPWKGAPVMQHLYNKRKTRATLETLTPILHKIKQGLHKDITQRTIKIPKIIKSLLQNFPFLYDYLVSTLLYCRMLGIADLKPTSDFIQNYVAKGLKDFNIPIKAMAGVLVDFSHMFDPFPAYITKAELEQLNATYGTLIGGSPTCEHDMLLPVDTQHAIGLLTRDFECIKIVGTCHGNTLGLPVKEGMAIIPVKTGIAELKHEGVTNQVIQLIQETFYQKNNNI